MQLGWGWQVRYSLSGVEAIPHPDQVGGRAVKLGAGPRRPAGAVGAIRPRPGASAEPRREAAPTTARRTRRAAASPPPTVATRARVPTGWSCAQRWHAIPAVARAVLASLAGPKRAPSRWSASCPRASRWTGIATPTDSASRHRRAARPPANAARGHQPHMSTVPPVTLMATLFRPQVALFCSMRAPLCRTMFWKVMSRDGSPLSELCPM